MSEISKYITIIRPEFMAFCKDACRAATLNHLLFRIAGKSKDQPRENIQAGKILWYAKNELIASEMSDAWGVCKVRKEVNELVKMGLFGRKNNPTWGVDRTKHFCFGSEQCEIFLKYCEDNGVCVVHLDLPTEVRHLIYSSLANDRTIKCTCEKADLEQANDKSIAWIRYNHPMYSINLSPANDKSIEAITKTTTKTSDKDNNEEEGTLPRDPASAHMDANASPAREEPYVPVFDLPQRQVIQELSPVLDEKIEQVDEQRASLLSGSQPIPPSPEQDAGYEKPKANKKPSRSKVSEPELVFSPEGQKVYDAWSSLFRSPPRAAEKTVDCANDLYARLMPWCHELKISCKDLLAEIKGWCYTTDPDWYRRKGVTLCDIGAQFERWQSAKEEQMRQQVPKNGTKKPREKTALEVAREYEKRFAAGGAR